MAAVMSHDNTLYFNPMFFIIVDCQILNFFLIKYLGVLTLAGSVPLTCRALIV